MPFHVNELQLAGELLLVGAAVGLVASWLSVGRYLRGMTLRCPPRDTSHRPTVLVVDDDKMLREIIGTNLELGGFSVLSAPDGPSALALLDDHLPDVVVLDVLMPLMDGYATLGRIRRHATASHVPVIVLTGGGTDTTAPVKSLEAGADDFIAKPFSPQEMLARVRAKVRRAAVDASLQPLTRLPGNIAIEHEVRRRFEAREPWAVIYADLDIFKAFNDHYGFVRGDDAIRLVATHDERHDQA